MVVNREYRAAKGNKQRKYQRQRHGATGGTQENAIFVRHVPVSQLYRGRNREVRWSDLRNRHQYWSFGSAIFPMRLSER